MSSVNIENKSHQMLVLCASDCNFPLAEPSESSLTRFLALLKQSINGSAGHAKGVLFNPVPYGTEASEQSHHETACAHHTMPCPAIPIPRGADFIGRHASQVEADVHLPLPDAYRIFQLQQTIRSLQRGGEPLLLLAHTPGIIGFHVRREAVKRRARGKPIPLAAIYSTSYQRFTETRVVEIANAIRQDHSVTLNELFTHGGLLERAFPALADAPEVRATLERLIDDLRLMIHHWYTVPNSTTFQANRRWGQALLWIANSLSRYSHHRLQGSLAAARSLHELMNLLTRLVGVPLPEIAKRPIESSTLIDNAIADGAGQLVRSYLARFFSGCDRVLNLDGELGKEELQTLGINNRQIVSLDFSNDICDQLYSVYQSILADSSKKTAPKRQKLSEFNWESWDDPTKQRFRSAETNFAMSDVHLGDGSGTERALAATELKPHFDRLGVTCVDIVGDLIQRDVSPEVSARHRESFLAAMRYLTGSVAATERAVIQLRVDTETNLASNPKRQSEIRRELQAFALKVGAQVQFGDMRLGVPNGIPDKPIPIYIERGNHDEGEQLEEVVPGSHVAESMIRLDENSGVLFCHGNIWNLPEVPAAFKQALSMSELCEKLAEEKLRESLETAQIIYSMTSALWRACAKRIDVRGLWKNDLQPILSKFVQWQRDRHVDENSVPSEFSQFLTGVISPVDNAAVAAQCGILTRGFGSFCWAICDGHSHRASIEFVRSTHPQTGNESGTLLVNCGKFHGKNMTAVLLRFPEAVVVEWDEKEQAYYVLHYHRLTDEEIRIVCNATGEAPKLPNVPPANTTSKPARTLLEICSEGAGHKERQLALLPIYEARGTVHVAASGHRPISWAHEHWPGHRLIYDRSGHIRRTSTLVSYLRNQNAITRRARSVARELEHYTHAITDFAPVLPMAMKIAKRNGCTHLPPLFHISHHAAMHSRYKETPRPLKVDRLTYWATQRYLDSISGDVNIGFHFETYHSDILTPPIAPDFQNVVPTFNSNMVLVYLMGSPLYLAQQCSKLDPDGEHEWHIYSALQSTIQQAEHKHIWLFPLDSTFRKKLPHARAAVTSCGFMGPAELLHLGKPFAAIPTPGHGEHAFNAAALQEVSHVTVVPFFNEASCQVAIRKMLYEAKSISAPLQRTGRMGSVGPYQDIRQSIAQRVFGETS